MFFIPKYILILIITIIIDYIAGILISKSTGKTRKRYLLISLIANIGMLVLFKYFYFLSDNLSFLAGLLNLDYPENILKIILPLGLSFHTFQAMSYTIEVYRGNQEPEKNLIIYAVYVMFYPQLVAGPIERPQNLLHQFKTDFKFDYTRVKNGLIRMLWGLFKKMILADNLALLVNTVYNDPKSFSGIQMILATVFFAFQIYCDFSGYSDIALGSAQVMGFKLMNNFRTPYFAKSISEFWKRWHISLSTWFRDYLYIPLGGNRVTKVRNYFNVFIVFLVSGLWHGAKWNFVIWGALHGVYMVISSLTENFRKKVVQVIRLDRIPKLHNIIKMLITFVLVNLAWVFFRANSLSDSLIVLKGISKTIFEVPNIKEEILALNYSGYYLIGCICIIVFVMVVEYMHYVKSMIVRIKSKPLLIRWSLYYATIFIIIILGRYGNEESSQFIYFQF
jgi:D-alanyl-lipoteichoic acid acyltransferase DltB (MBOAT superfamily)